MSETGLLNIDSEFEKPKEAYDVLNISNVVLSEKVELELTHDNGWSIGLIELDEIKSILLSPIYMIREVSYNKKIVVPLIECANILLKHISIEHISISPYGNSIDIEAYRGLYKFGYGFCKEMYMYFYLTKGNTTYTLENQVEVFRLLSKLHIDYYGLIWDKLAISKQLLKL